MHLCSMDYKYFSLHWRKRNSFGCTAAIKCGYACRGPHSDSLYSGSEHRQFNSPRLIKREAGFPNPRRALIGSNQLWRVNDSPYYRELIPIAMVKAMHAYRYFDYGHSAEFVQGGGTSKTGSFWSPTTKKSSADHRQKLYLSKGYGTDTMSSDNQDRPDRMTTNTDPCSLRFHSSGEVCRNVTPMLKTK